MNLYQKFITKPYSFSIIDATLASDNPSSFKKESSRKNTKTNHDN